ncbi:MAG: flagellar biosynthesis protein FlhB [Burkholderiales bacterium]
MAEDSDLERTEPASPRRIEQAREKGQVARSRELSTFSVLFATAGALTFLGAGLVDFLSSVVRAGLTLDRASAFEPLVMLDRLHGQSLDTLMALLPFLAVAAIAAVLAPLLVGGWVFSSEALQFKSERLNPVSGLRRILSWQGIVEIIKAIAKTVVIGGVATWVIWKHRDTLLSLANTSLDVAVAQLGALLSVTFLTIAASLALIAVIDVPFQIWNYHRGLRMTREEVRREAKETEGDPQIRARIRSLQREAARHRMMSEVPKADVVVTNPTHYAVALRYSDSGMRAPQVVAKGTLLMAEQICDVAAQHGVPILSAPPLARALYRHTEIGTTIPERLYGAVAEVLAYVYQLRVYRTHGGTEPQPPRALGVPVDMDPAVARQ